MRTVGDELVAPLCGRVPTGSGTGEDRSAVSQRMLGRDAGPAPGGRLDDDRDVGDRRDDPVADGEADRLGPDTEARFAHDEPRGAHLRVERSVPAGILDVEPRRDDTDRRAAAEQGTFVGGGVDPDREAAHDGHTRLGEIGREGTGVVETVGSRGARADDGDTRRVERVGSVALGEEHRGMVGDGLGVDREAGVGGEQDAGSS